MADFSKILFPRTLGCCLIKKAWIQSLEGLENIPLDRSCIVIANHASYMDFLLLGTVFEYILNRRLHFWAKPKVTAHPIFKIFANYSRTVKIESGSTSGEFWRVSRRFLSQGDSIGIFPEGTRTRTGALGKFHNGYARLANATHTPVIPAVITNTFRILPPGGRIPGRLKSMILFHPPVLFEKEHSKDELEAMNHHIFTTYYDNNRYLTCHVDPKTD
jgi:1-acyl-sn-glycerol-3-phosphate acyltransferase